MPLLSQTKDISLTEALQTLFLTHVNGFPLSSSSIQILIHIWNS